MTTIAELIADLGAEHDNLDSLVSPLDPEAWAMPTPSPGWTVADQIGHLGFFDRSAALAISDPDAFRRSAAELLGRSASEGFDVTLDEPRSLTPPELLTWWRTGRDHLLAAAAALPEDARVGWYGPEMGAKSFLTARLMETWAHGQDVADTLGVARTGGDRLRHIAQLGVITRGWSYANRGMAPPDAPVLVRLISPTGAEWVWGDPDADASIVGPAVDFCQVVTQRRHVADTALSVEGDAAAEWMAIAQAFAGGATDGPAAGSFP